MHVDKGPEHSDARDQLIYKCMVYVCVSEFCWLQVTAISGDHDARHRPLASTDSAAATDSAFVRGLFLQRLPANVRMVLASAADSTSLDVIS